MASKKKTKTKKKIILGECKTVSMDVNSLIPADYNPRTMGDDERAGLSESIDTFGLVQPIIWNEKTGNVVGGHQRLQGLKDKGVKTTDVRVVSLSNRKEKALNIALNHRGTQGAFDIDRLSELMLDVGDDALLGALNVNSLDDIDLTANMDDWDTDIHADITNAPKPKDKLMCDVKVSCLSADRDAIIEDVSNMLEEAGYAEITVGY